MWEERSFKKHCFGDARAEERQAAHLNSGGLLLDREANSKSIRNLLGLHVGILQTSCQQRANSGEHFE